nr:MAG: polyprotein [Picornaviridae sp.]
MIQYHNIVEEVAVEALESDIIYDICCNCGVGLENSYSFNCDNCEFFSTMNQILAIDKYNKSKHFLVLNGIKGAISYVGSHTGYRKRSIDDKYNVSTSVHGVISSVTIYKSVIGHVNSINKNEFILDSHEGSTTFEVRDAKGFMDLIPPYLDELGGELFVSLSDAVWLKSIGYFPESATILSNNGIHLYASIALPSYSILSDVDLDQSFAHLQRCIFTRIDTQNALKLVVDVIEDLITRVRVEFDGKPIKSVEAQGLFGDIIEEATDVVGRRFPFNVPNVVNSANNILSEIENHDIVDRVDSILNTIEVQHAQILKYVSNFMRVHFTSAVDTSICDAILFIDCMRALLTESWYGVISCVVRLGSRLGINSVIIQNFCAWIQRELTSPQVRVEGNLRVMESQGGIEVSHIFVSLVGLFFLHQVSDEKTIKKVVEFARESNISIPFVRSLGELFNVLPNFLPATVQAWLQYICPAEAWFNFVHGGFRDWADRCELFLTPANETKCKYDRDVQNVILQLAEEGKRYVDLATSAPRASPYLFQCINRLVDKIDSFVSLIEVAKGTRGHRMPPFVVSLYGDSDIGKSGLIPHVAALLRPDDYPKNNLVYCRQAGTDFWDGYTGQFCTTIDDYTQFVESDDYKEMVSMCTSEVYYLPMASLSDKTIGVKGTVFSSDLIVTTTNVPFPSINDVRTRTAIWRRRNLLWNIEILPEYTDENGKVVWENIPVSVLQNFEHITWRLHHSTEPTVWLTDRLTTREAFKYTLREWNLNRAREIYLFRERDTTAFVDNIREQFNNNLVLVEAQGLRERLDQVCQVKDKIVSSISWEKIKLEIESAKKKWYDENPKADFVSKILLSLAGFVSAFALFKWIGQEFSEDSDYNLVLTDYNPDNFAMTQEQFAEFNAKGRVFIPESAGPTQKIARTARLAKRNVVRYAEGATGTAIVPQSAGVGFIDLVKEDEACCKLVYDTLSSNMVYCYVTYQDKPISMCGFAFGYDFVLFPYHLFLDPEGHLVPKDTPMCAETIHGGKFDVLFDPDSLFQLKNERRMKDVVVYKMGPRMRPFPSRVSQFIRKDDISSVRMKPGIMTSYRASKMSYHNIPVIRDLTCATYYKVGEQDFILTTGWEYYVHSMKGDCGAVLCVQNNSLPRKIIGIHIAGHPATTTGMAEIVFQEELQEVLDKFAVKVQALPKPSANILTEQPRFVIPEGNFTVIGKLPDKEVMRLPSKTSICPSEIFEGVAKHVTEPAVLSPRDPRLKEFVSSLELGIAKYSSPSLPFKKDILKIIVDDMIETLQWPGAEDLFILNDSEAINGIPGKEYFDSMNMQSSPGWPFKLKYPGKTKEVMFEGVPPERVIKDQDLANRLKGRELCAKQGCRVPSAWVDCLKDERRKLEKIYSGKTRVFAIAPVDFVILMRKYFLSFAARFYHFRKVGWSAVGVDCESPEWNDMVQYLLANSDEGFAGDFGRFDGTLSADCIDACLQVIEKLYCGSIEDKTVRAVLVSEIIHSVHLALDAVYVCHGGNPSGNPLTVVINTMVNFMYLSYCWLHLVPIEWRNMRSFHACVRAKIYGDDNWVSVKQCALPYFNLQTVSKFLSTLGIEYLSPLKEVTLVESDKIVNWSFLKRKSTKLVEISHMQWLAQIDFDVINELTNWIRECDDHLMATIENCQTALRFCFFHGYDTFMSFRESVRRAFIRKNQYVPHLHTWSELRNIYLNLNGFQVFEAQGDTETNLNMTATDGILLPELQSVQVETPTASKMSTSSRRAQMNMEDESWDLQRMVTRFNFVGTYTWAVGDIENHVIQQWELPLELLTLDINNTPFDHFLYWRGDIVVRFQLNGTRFHCGRAIAFFCPLMLKSEVDAWHGVNKPAQTTVNHLFLDPSISSTVELKIPFVNYRNYIFCATRGTIATSPDSVGYATSVVDYLGRLRLQVFNPLQASAGAATNLNISVWASFPNSEFHVPTPTSELTLLRRALKKNPNLRNILDQEEGKGKKKEKVVDHDFVLLTEAMREAEPQGNTVSSKVTNVIQRAGDITMPIEVIGDKIDADMDVSGMDKVNVGLQPFNFVRKPLGYTSHSENVEFLQRLCLKPSALTLTDQEHFGTRVDEMNLDYLFHKSTFLRDISWGLDNIPGDVLAGNELAPIPDISQAPGVTLYYPSLLQYVSTPFTFWRGGFVFHFDIVATAFMTGKLWFGVHYGQLVDDLSPIDVQTDTYGCVLDLNAENHHFTIHVPYIHGNEWLRVPTGYGYLLHRQPVTDQESFTARNTCSMGRWQLSVLNGLVSPDGSPPSIKINMFISGADDYEVSFVGATNVGIRRAYAQGSNANVDNSMPATPEQRHAPAMSICTGGVMKKNFMHFGESYTSLKDVLKRYAPISYQAAFNNQETNASNGYVSVFGRFPANVLLAENNIHSYFASIYRCWRGSVRYKVQYPLITTRVLTADDIRMNNQVMLFYTPNPYAEYDDLDGAPNPLKDEQTTFAYTMGEPVTDTWTSTVLSVPTPGPSSQLGRPRTSCISPPTDFANDKANYNEIEVPFVTMYNILKTPKSTDYGQVVLPASPRFLENHGLIYTAVWTNNAAYTATVSQQFQSIMGSVGDDFRLGLLLGPHAIWIQGLQITSPDRVVYSMYGDTYLVHG